VNILKKVLRKALRKTRDLLADDSPDGPFDSWAGSYTLNPIFVEVLKQDGCHHQYAWGMVQGVNLAKALGIGRVSVLEFGVAGGNGLVSLERIARKAQDIFGVTVDVFGFDTGIGLPKPKDHRDMPNLWSEGFFPMDPDKLKRRLERAQLILGDTKETVPKFILSDISPVAFASFDLDFYTSTMHALALFEADHRLLLPRVQCYFDDVLAVTFGDHVGERLAISEFNESHKMRKISPIYGLRYFVPERYSRWMWEKQYMAHIFDHPLYGNYDGSVNHENTKTNWRLND
jgi:hypothetical protein